MSGEILIRGNPRPYDLRKCRHIAQRCPQEHFQARELTHSPFLSHHPGRVIIHPMEEGEPFPPAEFGFRLLVNGEEAGSWTGSMLYGAPSFWPESGAPFYLHLDDFFIKSEFRHSRHPDNWYAAAFCRGVHGLFLAPTFPGWILDANTTSLKMNSVFEEGHGLVHLIKLGESSWQAHAFLDPLDY